MPSAASKTVTAPRLAPSRPPQQHRSRESLGRMLDAVETLLTERGSDDFALTEVSRVGKVSIGSIYARFASRDELIHAVHERLMERLEQDQSKIVMRARSRSTGHVELVKALLDDLAEFLKAAAPVMRPMMLRASADRVVQERGRVAYDKMANAIAAEIMTCRAAIRHEHPEQVVQVVVQVAYASFARELGFGMTEATPNRHDWEALKFHIGSMSATYLFFESASA